MSGPLPPHMGTAMPPGSQPFRAHGHPLAPMPPFANTAFGGLFAGSASQPLQPSPSLLMSTSVQSGGFAGAVAGSRPPTAAPILGGAMQSTVSGSAGSPVFGASRPVAPPPYEVATGMLQRAAESADGRLPRSGLLQAPGTGPPSGAPRSRPAGPPGSILPSASVGPAAGLSAARPWQAGAKASPIEAGGKRVAGGLRGSARGRSEGPRGDGSASPPLRLKKTSPPPSAADANARPPSSPFAVVAAPPTTPFQRAVAVPPPRSVLAASSSTSSAFGSSVFGASDAVPVGVRSVFVASSTPGESGLPKDTPVDATTAPERTNEVSLDVLKHSGLNVSMRPVAGAGPGAAKQPAVSTKVKKASRKSHAPAGEQSTFGSPTAPSLHPLQADSVAPGAKRTRSASPVTAVSSSRAAEKAAPTTASPSHIVPPVKQARRDETFAPVFSPPKQQPPVSDAPRGGGTVIARLFKLFLSAILDESPEKWEEAAAPLERAFFMPALVANWSDGPTILQELQATQQAMKRSSSSSPLSSPSSLPASPTFAEYWVVLYFLGSNLNYIQSTITLGKSRGLLQEEASAAAPTHGLAASDDVRRVCGNVRSVLEDACRRANLMCTILVKLVVQQRENHVPHSVIPLILQRVRNTTELASDVGVSMVASEMRAAMITLYRYLRVTPLAKPPESAVDQSRARCLASIVAEMIAVNAIDLTTVSPFIDSFHRCCPHEHELRCTLYHHIAHAHLQEALSTPKIIDAQHLFAKALVMCPNGTSATDDATRNRRLLYIKLTATALAVGRVPDAATRQEFGVHELDDIILAVQRCSLQPYFDAMRVNATFYVKCGIYNVLSVVRQRLFLLMVVQFYVHCPGDRMNVQELIAYHRLPLTVDEACYGWLLPLLMEKRINGVMEKGYLVLNKANPFDEYPTSSILRP